MGQPHRMGSQKIRSQETQISKVGYGLDAQTFFYVVHLGFGLRHMHMNPT